MNPTLSPAAPERSQGAMPSAQRAPRFDTDLIVIGSGFGGTMTALTIAHKLHPKELREAQQQLKDLLKQDPMAKEPATQKQRGVVDDLIEGLKASGELLRIEILERGTWWTTPIPTVQDPDVKTPQFLKDRGQPVQFWSSLEHFKGLLDLFTRCSRRPRNEDGLYDITHMGKRPLLGLFGGENDGVSVLRASGVGGGSLVYSNITVRPPEFIFADWDTTWDRKQRDTYYELAKHAIGYGITQAWDELARGNIPYQQVPNVAGAVNAGLSNVSSRTARLDPHWETTPEQLTSGPAPRTIKRLGVDGSNWITRARVFQSAVRAMRRGSFQTVDSSINDLTAERVPPASAYDPLVPSNHPPDQSGAFPKPVNYCERHGRCTLGCLPGARHTLNKQLMAAAYGKATDAVPVPQFPNIKIVPLAEVEVVEPSNGGWRVHYLVRDPRWPWRTKRTSRTARRVIVAAGCLGTNELLLRSRDRDLLPDLSAHLGAGFSTNGDYLAFLEGVKEPVNLVRGPVQTSVAHFNDQPGENNRLFHIVEDQGIPRAFSSTVKVGLPLIRSITHHGRLAVLLALARGLLAHLWGNVLALFRNARQQQEFFRSEEELTMHTMCITASGRTQVAGRFRPGHARRESPLRVTPANGVPFFRDPILRAIDVTLNGPGGLAEQLLPPPAPGQTRGRFRNPFLSEAADARAGKSVTITHPLGGCAIGTTVSRGVVDEYGHVFKVRGDGPFYDGLYVADAAIIPSALGVNPSLTISALTLRIGEHIAAEIAAEIVEKARSQNALVR